MEPRHTLSKDDALIVVDVQLDFCAGGALAVEGAGRVVPVLNQWIDAADALDIPIYASRDWHPRRHPSFTAFGGPWPAHCVQDTEGARFRPDLKLPASVVVVTKGVRFDRDQNSAFDETGLAVDLRAQGVVRVWIGGLAQDVCVRATVLDALREGFKTTVITDATRPVTPDGGRQAEDDMRRAGATLVTTA